MRLDGLADAGEGRVLRALAGDLLQLEDRREVKLAGVEAPGGGTSSIGAAGAPAPFAAEAQAELARRAAGKRVQLLAGGALADDQGRALAQVRVRDGAWLQGALLAAGGVRVRPAPGDRALASDMLALEAHARARRRGLWALDAYRVLLPQELTPWASGLQLVEGRVRRSGRTRDLAYLDFSRDWRTSASVEVPHAALRDFEAAGLDLSALEGRLVRVRGETDRLRLTVDTPEAVELLAG